MANHFACIGFPDDASGIKSAITTARSNGTSVDREDGGRLITWRDASGAIVVVNTGAEGDVLCAQPSYRTEDTVRVRPTQLASDPDCGFCDPLLVEMVDPAGEMLYPLAFMLEDVDLVRRRLPLGEVVPARLVGMVERVEVWRKRKAFDKEQRGSSTPVAAGSLIPSGLFGAEGSRLEPRALVTGVVEHAERRPNGATGRIYWWTSVRTYGTALDLLFAESDVQRGLVPGNVVRASVWLIGRLELDGAGG